MKFKIFLLFFLFLTVYALPQIKNRDEIPDKYKWDLSILYSDLAEWKKDKELIQNSLNKFLNYKGTLDKSSENLFNALTDYFSLLKTVYKFYDYSTRLGDENLLISENQSLAQQSLAVLIEVNEKTSFLNPEILNINQEKINSFFAENSDLENFRFFIEDIQRLKDHTLSADEEKILASFGLPADAFATTYNIFNDAEMIRTKVVLSDGSEIELTPSSFVKYRALPDQKDRMKIFESFFTNYSNYKNTFASNFAGKLKTDVIYAKSKKYNSSLEYALNGSNIPVSVYETLISQINNNLSTLHRFLELKKRMLGLDTLHYYDIYTSMVKEVDFSYTVEEGQQILLKALKPLGEEYISVLEKAYNERWIDYMPNVGKKSGAYSSGAAYDYHPYILMNWNDDLNSVSTLAHELGHTMHSYYSNKTQPFHYSNYSSFVAEIASTINEDFLTRYMTDNSKSNDEKLYILGSYLELLRGTVFRQTLFAEFELAAHKLAENNEPITGDVLSDIYYNLVKKYYGHDEGICIVDPYIAYEWEFIPHFLNYTYYVYQYATSLIYATAIAQKVYNEGKPAVDNFYLLLKGGNSKYPIELIKDAGIDPLSSEPFELTMKKMNDVMDQIEEILNKK